MQSDSRKIKICHLASGDLWAGAEIQVVNTCRGLIETGTVEVCAITLNEGRLAEELRSLELDVTVIDEQINPWWRIVRRLTRHFRRRPVDIVHTHRYKENILGSMAARKSGVPNIVRTVHGTTEFYSGWKWVKIKAYKALDYFVCRYLMDGLIGVSREISKDLRRRFPGKLITHIPNCIDERRLVPATGRQQKRLELGLKPYEFVLGTVGRLNRVKGLEFLIRALPEIVKHHGDVRLLVVGDGPLRGGMEELARSMGLERMITFLGWRHDAIEIINTLDLFVLPSLHEGMPTALLEAMSLGIPVVASATGGILEVVTDGRNGLLATPGNEPSLTQKCTQIISDSTLVEQLVRNARKEICKYYLKQTTPRLLILYRCLVDGVETNLLQPSVTS